MAYTGTIPDTGAHRLDWMDAVACRDQQDVFDDPGRDHEARTICVVRCPVRSQCLAAVKEAEHGKPRGYREGVVAGLFHNERWRLDLHAYRGKDDAAPLELDGTEECGSYNALLGHLWRGEKVDPVCWSAELRRSRLQRTSAVAARARAVEAKPAAEPKPVGPPRNLTPQARRVYRLWSSGLSDPEIARQTDLTTPAVQRIRQAHGLMPHLHVAS